MREFWYLTSKRMTIGVETVNLTIVDTPPIAKVFIGQKLRNLVAWMSKQPGFHFEEI